MSPSQGVIVDVPPGCTWADYTRVLALANGVDRELSDDEIDFLLWERTAWPVADFEYVRDQLIGEFLKDEGERNVSGEQELQVLEPVDELPEDRSIRARQSKWDAIIELTQELADKDPGKWLPITRPKNFA